MAELFGLPVVGDRLFPVHLLEHFFSVALTSYEISSREPALIQRWVPLKQLEDFDLRPHIVRDAIANNEHLALRHLIVPL